MSVLGVFSDSAGITEDLLENGPLPVIKDISNGLALELKAFCDKNGHKPAHFVKILTGIDQQFSTATVTAIVNKVNYLKTQKSKLLHKKKVKGVKNVNELLQNPFKCPQSKCAIDNFDTTNIIDSSVSQQVLLKSIPIDPIPTPPVAEKSNISTATQTDQINEHNEGVKNLNVLSYKTKLKEKRLEKVNLDLQKCQEQLNSIRGHYSVKNINKRDQTARQNLKKLRNSERTVRKQQAILKSQSIDLASITELHNEIDRLKRENLKLKDQIDVLSECADFEKTKKVALQKSNSYLKGEVNNLKSKVNKDHYDCDNCVSSDTKITVLTQEVTEKQQLICDLEEELSKLNSKSIETKSDKGVYTSDVRLCILELAALEVATEKMAPVIRSVISHLAGKGIKDLPNKTTSQKIIDEGHYLCKALIADKLENSKHWGMGRDGTTRRKQKILDTSVTVETGETMTLGFTRVAQETASTIQTVTEKHLDKLTHVKKNPSYLADTLSKLSFTMSDRASNEKKADKLLDEWRNEMLADYPGEKEDVLHFHCMAHVLLGFHNYTTPPLKDFEQLLKDKNPNSESEKITFFTPWKSESVTSRVVRQVSDTFAPAGSHLGVRDRWEAFCAKNGIKSLIGNYKDNRFNALFQTAAEVFVHRKDFVSVLNTVINENGKLAAVKKELESEHNATILQCLGLFYLKFTGPYWNLVTSGKVPYLHLWEHVDEIVQFLEKLETDPAHLLLRDQHWSSSDPLDIKRLPNYKILAKALFNVHEERRDILLQAIQVVAAAMLKCVWKQLVDFLPEGKFFKSVSGESTSFASVNNLACERQFGGLDASQTRRPGATLHHHSSVLMLKENRQQLVDWIKNMSESDKKKLFSDARCGGKILRKEYQDYTREVLNQIHDKMSLDKEKKLTKSLKTSKRKAPETVQKQTKKKKVSDSPPETLHEPVICKLHDYVAVAYQEEWYPGCIKKVIDEETFEVTFMSHCSQRGHFQWPMREDKQIVERQFILSSGFVPDCVGTGRQWHVKEHETISQAFAKYQEMYF